MSSPRTETFGGGGRFSGYWSHWFGSRACRSWCARVGDVAHATGFEGGRLGYPVTDEVGGLKDGGVYQNYQGGAIFWSPATGAHISVGGIRSLWASTGYESGRLGYPISDEYLTGNDGSVAQNYQGGVIHWSPGVPTSSGPKDSAPFSCLIGVDRKSVV